MRTFYLGMSHKAPGSNFTVPKDILDDIIYIYNHSSLTYSEIYRQGVYLFIQQWKHEQYIKAKRLRQSKRRYLKIRQAFALIHNIQNNIIKKAIDDENAFLAEENLKNGNLKGGD